LLAGLGIVGQNVAVRIVAKDCSAGCGGRAAAAADRAKALVRIVAGTWKFPVSGLYDIGDQFMPPMPDGWISVGSSQ
jgi:hypothetical protein